MKKNALGLLVISTLISLNCTKEPDYNEDGITNPGGATPGKVNEAAGFNIRVKNPAGTSYYIHKNGDFTKECQIIPPVSTFAEKDITCIIEIEELEGLFHGLDMVLNVPSNICQYVSFSSYFYFGEEPGQGPAAATANFNIGGGFAGGVIGAGGSFDASGNPQCDYDYSSAEGPNCCYGTYTKTANYNVDFVAAPDPAPYTVVTTEEWGGKAGNCAAGAGADLMPRSKQTNMPISVVYDAQEGRSESFPTGGSSLLRNAGSLIYANFYNGAIPTAFNNAGTYKGNPNYVWSCYDNAEEYKYRITVRAREWNESAQFLLKGLGNPDTSGVETDWVSPINDSADWNDVVGYPGMPD